MNWQLMVLIFFGIYSYELGRADFCVCVIKKQYQKGKLMHPKGHIPVGNRVGKNPGL